jgi:transposase
VSEPVLDREVRRRLAVLRHVEEVSGNVAQTCRYFGISRPTYYTWLRRYQADGVDGLRTRSKRPRTSPNATRAEVVDKIIHLRRNYHFGPGKIAMYLQRYHDVTISVSTVWRILHRLDLGRLPASQRYQRHDRRWKRYEKQRPVIRCRSTSSSSIRCPRPARPACRSARSGDAGSSTSSRRSTTAPGYGS